MPDASSTTILAVLGSSFVVTEIALRIAALGIIPARRKPSTGVAWLLLVLLKPGDRPAGVRLLRQRPPRPEA